MWREKILEAKKLRNIKTKTIAEAVLMSEKAVSRLLTGEKKSPCIEDVIAVGAAVGLTALELFAETDTVIGEKSLSDLNEELDKCKMELDLMRGELANASAAIADLKAKNCALTAENDILRIKLELKDEIIETHKYYIKEKYLDRSDEK